MTTTRRVLAATVVGAALALPTVTFPAVADAAPSYTECVEMYGYEKPPREINPKTGLPRFAQKRGKLTQEASDCIKAGEPKHGNKHLPLKIGGALLVMSLCGAAYRKLTGAAEASEAELAKCAQQEWEQQQEQPVYDYDDYSPEPTYTEPEPAPTAPTTTPNQRNDDGWDF